MLESNPGLRPIDHFYVPCIGCGNTCVVKFLTPKLVLAAPMVACSTECLNRWAVSTAAFLEKQVRDT